MWEQLVDQLNAVELSAGVIAAEPRSIRVQPTSWCHSTSGTPATLFG